MSQRKGNVITFFSFCAARKKILRYASINFFLRRKRGGPFHALILSFCADRKKVYKERTAAQVLPSLAPHRAGGAVKSLRSDTAVSRLPDTAQPTYVGTARP